MLVILFFFIGLLLGFITKKHQKIIQLSEKSSSYIVYLLVFLLGISVGYDKEIMSNLSKLGLTAFSIAIASVLGSVIITMLVEKLFFKDTIN
ncbi:MAG: LysO family transporter [Candidatus Cloacimonetes bacterium]|nr:LysO family transporter [Candidatus Cloacimonadota bacterium]